MRRVNCRRCGVVVEQVPWGEGKHQLTGAYMLFLARWARKPSWKETAEAFHTFWEKVCDAVQWWRSELPYTTVEQMRGGQTHCLKGLVYEGKRCFASNESTHSVT